MGLIAKEIIQTKAYETTRVAIPQGNHKNIYPITILEAVKETWDEGAENLKDVLDSVRRELATKQTMLAPKPANFLVTYGGASGMAGSIEISMDIAKDINAQSHDRIPTEKAVTGLLV